MRYKGILYRISTFAVVTAVILSSAGCSRFATPNRKLDISVYNPESVVSKTGQYIIGVRDELEIMVWKCPELNTMGIVRSVDGMVAMPLIGDVKAAGLTPLQLAEAISDRLAYYVKEPRVAVRVVKMGEKKVFLLGQVMRPGTHRLEKGDRVLDLLSNAGGFNDNSLKSGVYIVRGGYYDSKIIRVNLGRLIHKGDMTQNVFLEEGDMVYVPEQEIENLNYALRKIFPSMYFAERLNDLKQNIMTGGYDWHQVWNYIGGTWRK